MPEIGQARFRVAHHLRTNFLQRGWIAGSYARLRASSTRYARQ
jgi:hypothetical protein